ncbi:hypothetical protein SBA3_2890014 [Candidatus Sulfopaludibacter sp. SbA3]|nr:hypothetical protein SBA3_2890014 [Candidatus Sulfopaludibacter sp. SbA3]
MLATAQLNNGTITLWTNALGVGNHNIVAYYSGNGLFNGSGSPAIPLTVSSRALPTITLSSSMNPVVVNASTVITVTVTGNSSQPTGSVQLFDGGTLLTTGTLTNGTMQYTATFTTSGTHPLSAVYSGDGNFSQATSLTLNQVVQPLTNVVLTVDSNPSTVGSSVTFTATLTPSSASGTVQFTDSGVSLGTAAVVNGRATLSVANLGLGVHYIQAIYTGDSATAPGSSSPLTQTVRAATTTVLSTSATPSTYSQAITFTAAVSPSSATGTVQFLDGAAVLGSAPVSLGSAVLTVSSLVGGSHTITAIYSGDSANSGSTSAPLSQSVSPASPVITITTLSNPTTVGSFLLFNMSMKPASPSAALQVFDGQTLLATVNNSTGGAASYSTTTLAAGFHSITASWAGDSNVLPGVSAVLNEQIQSSTAISVTATGPVTYGQSVTVTATVSPATASGNVMFNDGGSNLGTVPLTGGVASISYVPSSAGSHLTVATFNDPNNIYIGSVANVTINVAQVTTSATVAVSPNPSNVGQVATLTATLSPAGATGNMMFYDGATFIGTGTLSNGTASMSYLFRTGGSHSITASFQGNNNYAAATSPAVMQIVKTATTTTVSGAGTSTYEQAVSLVATVAPAAATGTIQFLDGTTPLGAVTTAAGSATLNISTLGAGSHAITAIYSGDANYAGSTSAVVTQTVQKASVTVTLSSNANPSVAGQTLGLTAAISDPTATGTIQFLDGSTVVGASAIASGSAGFNTSALLAGSHSLTAVYSGDANFNTSTSTALAQTVKATTSTSLGADTVTPAFGQTIHLTSSITPAGATGTVQFLDGVTLLGAVTVSGGTATLPISLSTGSHTISAAYSGDANDGSSTSAALAVTVGKASSLVALSSSVNPSAPGQAVTLTAGVTPTSATGSVQFLDGTTVLGTSALSGGSATLSISNLTSGNHAITATYSGDGNYSGNSASLSQTVKATTTTSLAANPSPAVLGQTVQLTASISPSSATGTVQFLDGSTALGTAAASNGAASLSIATLQVGAHSLTAVYSGDGGNIGSTSAVLALTVSKASSTVTLAAAPNPITIGQSVTFTATVSPSSATGSVQFLDGAAAIGTVTLNGGAATLIAANLAAGAHSVTAVYSGDANTSGSNSTVVTVTVAKAGASVTLGSSPNPSLAGQTVAFTATVSPGSATGSVQFLDGATAIGTAAVSAGVATLSTTGLAAGSHSITAVYSGDTSYNGATSGVVTQAVTAVTTTSLSANKTTAVSGQAVTFTATVSPAAAPGSVQFLDAATTIGTVTLSGGAAVLAVSNLAVGSHSVTASYLGAAGYTASTSAAVSVTITPAPPGAPASLTATAISSSQINLSWTASATSGVTYNVYAAAAAGFAPSASNRIASGLSATSYANTGLTPAATRYYLVTAQNANGESAASNQASATTQASGLSCSVVYTVTTQWNVGFGTAITIKNTGSTPINGWQLKWTWAGNQQITEAWNSNYTQSGANATLTNAAWNSTIAAGSTVSGIGFNGSYSGSNPAPAAFYVNGTLCH